MSKSNSRNSRGATWLALSLSLGYLALMASLMWLFERALTLDELGQMFDNPRLIKSWSVIGSTALGIFMVSRWALGRMSAIEQIPGATPQFAAGGELSAADVQPKSLLAELVFLLALAGILAGTGSFIVREQERSLNTARFRQFAIIGATKARSVGRWIDERQRDLRVLLDNPSFATELTQWVAKAGPGATLPDSVLGSMQAVLEVNSFDGYVVVDPRGRVLLNLPEDLQARAICQQLATQAKPAKRTGELKPQLSFAFGDAKARPKVDIIATVYDQQQPTRQPVATVCLRVDLSQRLLPLVSHWPGVARSGEVLIGRPDGPDIVWLNDRPAADGPWRVTRLAGARADWESTALDTEAGRLRTAPGAGGRHQLHSAYAVAGSPWLLMVRMDAEESDQLQSRNQMRGAVALGFLLIFVVGTLAVAWARSSYGRSSFHAQRDALLVQLRDLAYCDELTGMPGRRLIQDRLDVALKDAERRKEQVGLMFIDLDKFKLINDSHGHAAGDAVLKACAERLQASMRRNDSAGRLAGDEFLVILPGVADRAALDALRAKVAAALTQQLPWQGESLAVGVSIGLALYPEDAGSAADLIAYADAAMYRQKQSAR